MPPSRGNRTSLLVRNIPMDCRPDELRAMFARYGDVRDCYMPRDFYTGKPRGFGFVEFLDPRDADDAMYALDRTMVGGREIQVCMSKEDRKTPREMVHREEATNPRARGGRARSPPRVRDSRDRGYDRRRDDDRDRTYSRGRERSPERGRSRRGRSASPSRSPVGKRPTSRSVSRSRSRSRSPVAKRPVSLSVSRSRSRSRSKSRSRSRSKSPAPEKRAASRSVSRSPARSASPRRSASRSPTPP